MGSEEEEGAGWRLRLSQGQHVAILSHQKALFFFINFQDFFKLFFHPDKMISGSNTKSVT